MEYKAVITGDIVDSSKSLEYREKWIQVIKETCDELSKWGVSFYWYRGDGFQILLNRPEIAAKVALILRCSIKASCPKHLGYKWDARLSIGIGTVKYFGDSVSNSDGEAFRFSGRGLDAMKKSRLTIHTPWGEFNDYMKVCTLFVDTLVTSWTIDRAYLMLKYLSSNNKKDLEEALGESQQNVSKKLIRTQTDNVDTYLELFKTKVEKLTGE